MVHDEEVLPLLLSHPSWRIAIYRAILKIVHKVNVYFKDVLTVINFLVGKASRSLC